MTIESFLDIIQNGVFTFLMVAAPVLLLSLGVGLLIGIFQAVTQINEQTLSFVPKILVVFLSIAFFGGWMLQMMMDYFMDIMTVYFPLI